MSIRKIDTNIGTVPTWGDEDFDANVHENFTSLKNIVPKINNTVDDIDLAVNEMNILKNQAENVTTRASSSASLASQKASEANTSANQALTYKNQVMGYVVPSGASYSVEQINTQNVAMIKAQFNALADERKVQRAGSGWDEMGKHSVGYSSVNNGIICTSAIDYINAFQLGWNFTSHLAGDSKTNYPLANVNGVLHKLFSINRSTTSYEINKILLPTAPNIYPHDTVLTAEQIASGVIKHADASNSGLIVNGKFDVDTSGWMESLAGSISQEGGSLKITSISRDRYAYQAVTCVIGKEYIVEFNGKCSDQYGALSVATTTLFGTPIVNFALTNNSPNMDRYTFKFTATATTMYIRPKMGGANSIAYYDNIAVYPADAISRSDLVFLESWHEDISEKNFVYPLGNVQYLGVDTDSLTGIARGNFTGFETYSLFGNFQASSALIGKGYVWSTLTEAQKKAFIANPENNCYLDGDKVIQVRYRVRVVQGLGDNWINITTDASLRYDSNINNVALKGKLASITSDFVGDGLARFITYMATVAVAQASIGSFAPYNSINSAYEGKCFALPIALVHRRNQGMYHPVYNPNGTKKASDGNFWYNTAVSFTSISDCFDASKLLTESGYIGSVSGRPDGLFYDQVHEGDITDLRNSSKKVEDYNRLISREFNKLVAGTTRGKEGEWEILTKSDITLTYGNYFSSVNTNNYLLTPQNLFPTLPLNIHLDGIFILLVKSGTYAGKVINAERIFIDSSYFQIGRSPYPVRFTDGSIVPILTGAVVDVVFARQTTRTKSNTLLHCDIIGNPVNYPTSWKQNGVFGTPLIVAEDGTSLLPDGARDTFKLSRKANETPLLALRSTDSGATWTSFTPTFSTITNEITLTNEPAGNLVMVYYQTHTSMAVPVTNSEIIEYGKVLGTDGLSNAHFISTLIGKVPTANTAPYLQDGYSVNAYRIGTSTIKWSTTSTEIPTHTALTLAGGAVGVPAVKVFPYLTRTNGKAYLNLVFKEMKHNGTSWGDDNKFNIVDNVSTTTDNNAQTVLIGQKTVELPYFIGADE